MRNLEYREIQEIEIDLLLKFHECCEKYRLRYILAGGTLLGAIRHNGFIPWDDDIDVFMPRVDYEKLLQLQEQENVFQDEIILDLNKNYPFVKLLNKNTRFRTDILNEKEMNHLWIDIFPLDGLPKDDKQYKMMFRYCFNLKRMYMLSVLKIGYGDTYLKKFISIFMIFLARLIGRKRIARWIDNYCKRQDYDSSQYIGNLCWGVSTGEKMPKKEFIEERVKVTFEGHEFWGPKCWDYYLTQIYGNYMELPPENKRMRHTGEAWIIE